MDDRAPFARWGFAPVAAVVTLAALTGYAIGWLLRTNLGVPSLIVPVMVLLCMVVIARALGVGPTWRHTGLFAVGCTIATVIGEGVGVTVIAGAALLGGADFRHWTAGLIFLLGYLPAFLLTVWFVWRLSKRRAGGPGSGTGEGN